MGIRAVTSHIQIYVAEKTMDSSSFLTDSSPDDKIKKR